MIKTPAGLPLTIALQIPTYWTPEQAFAVFELVTDLSDAHLAVLRPAADRAIP